jgi:hypothetical protein
MKTTRLMLLLLAAAPASAHNVRFTIASAKLAQAKLPSGMVRSNAHLSDLACFALPGLRALGDYCATGALPAGASPVDSLVRVEIKDAVIRTYTIPASMTPAWEYAAILDTDFLVGPGRALVALLDYEPDGSEKLLGEVEVPLADLARAGTRTLKLGPHELTYRVELLADGAPPRKYAFRVPADHEIAQLARTSKPAAQASSGYALIPVAEGEIVEISASGRVQPNMHKHAERVAGPEGLPTDKTKVQWNEPGFRDAQHASLIAQVGASAIAIGAKKRFTVEKPGLLVLGVNDRKPEDNAGGFDVSVTVSEPEVTPAAMAPATKKGSAADKPAGAIDARVVQQIVDSHGAELDACATSAANPYGEVVLQFAIAGDGALLGVTVEKASPNLKAAGDCMRKKALAWRFPPPRGVVTVRYPLSYAAE